MAKENIIKRNCADCRVCGCNGNGFYPDFCMSRKHEVFPYYLRYLAENNEPVK